jgi:hypothetical protein
LWGVVASGFLCTNAIGVGAVEPDEVFVGLRDVDEHARHELEGVHELGIVGVGELGFGLIDDELRFGMIAKPGQVHGRAKQVACETKKSFGVVGIDGGVIMNAEARMAPREEQVDSLLGDEVFVTQESEHFVAE